MVLKQKGEDCVPPDVSKNRGLSDKRESLAENETLARPPR